jgi:nucleotide-binding universal stress UspA family protein
MKVLVPVDGSKYSQEALKIAIDFVKTKGAEISVINVVPYIGGLDDHEISPGKRERAMDSMAKHADDIVKQACDTLGAAQVTSTCTRTIITSVSVPDAIIDFAENDKTDLIIMGSRGLSTSSRFKMGSVATQVVKYCPCSVYVVKMAED